MPIFTPDFGSVEAGITIYEKGRYRVLVKSRKPVIKQSRADEQGNTRTQAYMQYNLELVGMFDDEGNLVEEGFAGRTVTPFKCWLHSEGGWKYSKGFLIPACGYDRDEEQEANEEIFQNEDISWEFDGDENTPSENILCGDGWDLPVDRLVDVTLSAKTSTNDNGEEMTNQEFGGWSPVE